MLNFCVPCLFGLEGLVADELRRLDMAEVQAENGRVFFSGALSDIPRANLALACGERVLLCLGRFPAASFDQLFEGVRALPWADYIPKDGAFPVKGHALASALHSIPDCQKIVKKAVVEQMKARYHLDWFPETGAKYQIQFAIMKDEAALFLDTTGAGLHKRGYRPVSAAAPLRETLAAAMVRLARYRGRGDFLDPFCGSGTIPIEAAFAALNRAPGLHRSFAAMDFAFLPKGLWQQAREEAVAREYQGSYSIMGSDIDPKCVSLAAANARRAGVEGLIRWETAEATKLDRKTASGVIVTNPPYGERLLEKREAEALYQAFGQAFRQLTGWKLYLLSSHTEFERTFGRRADKKRKLYNGMIKCDLFMYL